MENGTSVFSKTHVGFQQTAGRVLKSLTLHFRKSSLGSHENLPAGLIIKEIEEFTTVQKISKSEGM